MKALTDRQQMILDWTIAFNHDYHMPPTVREIGREFGISSAGVFGHLKALQRKGYLKRGPMGARSLELTPWVVREHASASQVPIVGRIAAGQPLFAVENIDGFIAVDQGMLHGKGGKFFALRVKGDSMIEAGICEGDFVIVHKQETAENGDVVVALIGDEATLKQFYHENERIRLQPANHTMKPIYTTDVLVQGVVKGVIRRMGNGY